MSARQSESMYVGQEIVHYVKCPDCRASVAVIAKTSESKDGRLYNELDAGLLANHNCRGAVADLSAISDATLATMRAAFAVYPKADIAVSMIDAEIARRDSEWDTKKAAASDPFAF